MLILASKSPRRQEILRNAGIAFTVRAPQVEEVRSAGESPESYVRRLSWQKAAAVERAKGEVVLGADTVVVVEGIVLEKPVDVADAERMLGMLSGRTHEVLTGVCLLGRGLEVSDIATTRVRFHTLTAEEIAAYAASGEPADKAGAYAIQGLASKYIQGIDGCYFNVVGLPIALVYGHLRGAGGLTR
ncbi:MAG: septum formation inhibitor Maf [Bryobacterales bacterium]|nr:septum formation inhibitor Maf [Bryobacterales bacterium]